ncbi:hypothetical protein [Streptomyces sp. NPDC013457]|uniref:hypothetical protein n=1 Tax=Streptomyces sp. NPDC013457 TaxID=3364866 RepID=UPI0036FB7843
MTGRTPQDLAAELRDALAVERLPAWQGLPQLGGPEFRRLFDTYGWEYEVPVHERESLTVRTRTGVHLTIGLGTLRGVQSVSHYAWHVKAGDPSQKSAVLTRAAEAWSRLTGERPAGADGDARRPAGEDPARPACTNSPHVPSASSVHTNSSAFLDRSPAFPIRENR